MFYLMLPPVSEPNKFFGKIRQPMIAHIAASRPQPEEMKDLHH
jgi:hypothetical protein